MSVTAEYLSMLTGKEIQDTDGGFLIKEADGEQVIVLYTMIFSFRIVRTDGPSGYDRAWCYYGKDLITLIRAVQAALDWDGADDTSPEGWDKDAIRGVYRDNVGRIA